MSVQIHEQFVRACVAHDDLGVQQAIDRGLDLDGLDTTGHSPLHYAASYCNTHTAAMLLRAGADIDTEDKNGNTPLSDAIFYGMGRLDLVRLLLVNGADPHHANAHGVTPSQLARTITNYDYSELFPQ